MKFKNILSVSLMFLFITVFVCSSNVNASEKLGSYKIFVDLKDETAHGIAIDNNGNMYVGVKEGKSIVKVDCKGKVHKFITLKNTTSKTHIWNLIIGKDNVLYAAAGDRVLKITPNGVVSTIIKEKFEGAFGACGIRFDNKDNLYIVHGNKVNKYNSSFKKTTFIDLKNSDYDISTSVNIVFDKNYKNAYLSDIFSHTITKFSIDKDGKAKKISTLNIGYAPQYFVLASDGDILVTMAGDAVVNKISKNDSVVASYNCNYTMVEPNTIAFGKKAFDNKSVYVTAKGKIFKIYVGVSELN